MSSELVKELRSGDLLSTRHEAADRIEALEARNIEHEMRLEAEEAKSAHWKQRADRAEAQFAEARKALEAIYTEARSLPLHTSAVTREHVLTSKLAVIRDAARRALEAQGGE